jgi:hypothetical protein
MARTEMQTVRKKFYRTILPINKIAREGREEKKDKRLGGKSYVYQMGKACQ